MPRARQPQLSNDNSSPRQACRACLGAISAPDSGACLGARRRSHLSPRQRRPPSHSGPNALLGRDAGHLEVTRRRFGNAALFSANRPAAIADALKQALFLRVALEEQSRRLAQDLRRQHSSALDRLPAMLLTQRSISGGHTRVLRITQHPFPADSVVRRDVIDLTGHGYDVDVVCANGPDRDDAVADSPSLRIYRIPISHRRGRAIRYPLEHLAFSLGAFGLAAALGARRRYATVQVDNLPDFLVFAAAIPAFAAPG